MGFLLFLFLCVYFLKHIENYILEKKFNQTIFLNEHILINISNIDISNNVLDTYHIIYLLQIIRK